MPMQTFFNLPEDKKRTILKAARQEFSRVPLEQASIAHIIKTANIPRGSFYQYFQNKEDLYKFMMSNIGNKVFEKIVGYLKENSGDVIEASIKLFYYLMDIISQDENASFFKNMFLNMNDKMRDSLTQNTEDNHCKHKHFINLRDLAKYIDTEKLIFKEEKEVLYILRMIIGLFYQNLIPYFSGKISQEQAIESYLFQMNLIRKAIYKG